MEYSDKGLLQISLKRGSLISYRGNSFTDYMVNGDLFVVLNGEQWIGIYNMDCVEYVAYIPVDLTCCEVIGNKWDNPELLNP